MLVKDLSLVLTVFYVKTSLVKVKGLDNDWTENRNVGTDVICWISVHLTFPHRVRDHTEGSGHHQQEPAGLLPWGDAAAAQRRPRANPEPADSPWRPHVVCGPAEQSHQDPPGQMLCLPDPAVSHSADLSIQLALLVWRFKGGKCGQSREQWNLSVL